MAKSLKEHLEEMLEKETDYKWSLKYWQYESNLKVLKENYRMRVEDL